MSIGQLVQSLLSGSTPTRHRHHTHPQGEPRTPRGGDLQTTHDAQASQQRSQGSRQRKSFEDFEQAQQHADEESGRVAPGATPGPASTAALDPTDSGTAAAANTGSTDDSAGGRSPDTSSTSLSRATIEPSRAAASDPGAARSDPSTTASTVATLDSQPPSTTSPAELRSEQEVTGARPSTHLTPTADAQAGAPTTGSDYAQHYGTVPVLVAGQLVELDLYSLGSRQGAAPDSIRRLVLSLNSPGSSAVRITAEASEGRLKIRLTATGAAAPEALEEQVHAVGDLASRLGWSFEPESLDRLL